MAAFPTLMKRAAKRRRGLSLLAAAGTLALIRPPIAGAASYETPSGVLLITQNAVNPLANGARDQFDRVRFMDPFSTHFILKHDPRDPIPFFFYPPTPPTLEAEIPLLPPFDAGPPAPPQLAAFVNELFYPMLGSRLAYDELPRELRGKVLAYRDTKLHLQAELRDRVAALRNADPADRKAQLARLAVDDAPKLATLEAKVESLREELRPTNLLGAELDGPAMDKRQRWVIHPVDGGPPDPEGLRREAEALRYAAFFQAGLAAGQRRLLLEAAEDQQEVIRNADRPLAGGGRTFSFLPATARIPLPDGLAPATEALVQKFAAAKAALKAEIRNALAAQMDATDRERVAALRKLAETEGEPMARLEALAEQVREGLAGLPHLAGPPGPPPLPAVLVARITAYRSHKLEILRRLRGMIATPTPAGEVEELPRTAPLSGLGTGPLTWMHDGATTTEVQSTELRVTVSEFDRVQNELISDLNKEELGIRESLAAYVRASNGPADRKSINDLLRDFEDARQRQEMWDRYRDYQTAVLLPGLTPAQRQLLFDAGLEYLGLALPAGEKPE